METVAVHASRFLQIGFREEERVGARTFGALGARACGRKQGRVLRIKRRIGEVQMDFVFNPSAEFPHGHSFRFAILEDGSGVAMFREAFPQSALLVFALQSCDFKGVRHGEFRGAKRLFGFVYQAEQLQSPVHVSGRTSHL